MNISQDELFSTGQKVAQTWAIQEYDEKTNGIGIKCGQMLYC